MYGIEAKLSKPSNNNYEATISMHHQLRLITSLRMSFEHD